MTSTRNPAAIAVVGMSCWYPGARSPTQLWENILARRQEFRRFLEQRMPAADYHSDDPEAVDRTYGTLGAFLDGFAFDLNAWRIPKSTFAAADIAHWLAMDVAGRALADAGHPNGDGLARARVGVIVGNSLTGEQTRANSLRLRWPFVRRIVEAQLEHLPSSQVEAMLEAIGENYRAHFPATNEDTLAGSLSNTIAGRICGAFDFGGGGYVVDGACSSSLLAVCTAASALEEGRVDACMAGGVDISLDPFELVGFAKARALTPTDMRVYDRRGNGFVPGEGCGFVLLERLADARAAGKRVYAVLEGWGIASDGRNPITAPKVEGQARAIRAAWARSGRPDFVEGHGTGTAVGDRVELEAIALAAGDGSGPRSIGVTSLKSILGHTKAAAGIGAFLKAVVAVNRRVVPPMAGCVEPNAVFEGNARSLYPVRRGHQHGADTVVRAGASAMGFGGINTHVVVASADPPDPRLAPALPERALLASAQDSEIFVLGASTLEELRRQAIALARVAEGVARSELADLSAEWSSRLPTEPAVRAAVIASSPRELVRLLERSASLEQSAGPEIWLGRAGTHPRIGFLCPGQGSQELHAAAVLMARDPELDAMAHRLADVAAAEGCAGLLDALYPNSDPAVDAEEFAEWRARLRATQMAQPAICLVSLLWAARLRQLGIVPSVVAGHSLGELTAFALADTIDDATLMRLAVTRGRAMASRSERAGGMLSLEATVADVRALCSGIAGYLEIANVNAERQVVVSGEVAALDVLLERARVRSIQARRLAVSNGFHSELVADAARRLREQAPVPERLREPSVTLLSSLVDAPIRADSCELREHIAKHVRSPLDFVGLLERVADHCDVLVEVGGGRVLSGLAANCRPVEGTPGRAADLQAVLADAWVRGVAIRWDQLHVGRLIRPFVAPSERIFIGNPCETGPSARRPRHSIASAISLPPISLAPAISVPPIAITPAAPQARPSGSAPLLEDLLAQILRDVADKTGFDAASLSGTQRLQDDLNLDSIKAGEIVAAAARRAKVADRVDPALYLREPIEAIARALAELAAESTGAPLPETALVQPTAEPAAAARWVRTFGLFVELAPPAGSSDWSGASVRVLADPTIEEQLRNAGAVIDRAGRDVVAVLTASSTRDQVLELRRIVDALGVDVRSLLLVQRLDGRFGIRDPGQGPAAAGFGRSISLERPQLAVLVLDVAPSIPLVLERPSKLGFTAVGIDSQGRWSLVARPLRSSDYSPRPRLEPGELVLATGGARGITAACVEALARTTGVRLALVGSTPRDRVDDEIVRTLGRLALAGIEARYWPCDLADASAVATLVREVVASQGPIAAVVHGAGRNTPRRVEQVSADDALAEITPKLLGAEALLDALADAPPRMFVALTSIIGVSGMTGNAWYAYANEALDLAVARFSAQHPSCSAISLAFGVWSEIGMGVKLGSVASLARMGIGALDPNEGAARFVELVTRDPGVRQPIVTAHVDGLPTWPASWPSDPTLAFTDGALSGVPGVEARLRFVLHPDRQTWLRDHDFRGSLLLPTVFGLEAMAQVAWLARGGGDAVVAEVRDVELPAPIVVAPEGTTIELRASVREAEPGVVDCEIRTQQTDFARPHFSTVVVFQPRLETARVELLPELTRADPPLDPRRDLYGGLLFQGPAFQRIETVHGGGGLGGGARALRFAGVAVEGRWLLGDPFLRDAVLQAGQVLVAQDESLPVRLARWGVAAGHDVGGRREVLSTILHSAPRRHVGAAVVVDLEGRRLSWLEGYEVQVLAHRPERADLDEVLRPGLQRRARLVKLLEGRNLPAHVFLEQLALHGLPRDERHDIVRRMLGEQPGLERGLGLQKLGLPEIAWNEAGEPVLGDGRNLSVSHDDGACLVVVADVRVGCDIEPIQARADWEALLGPDRARLLPALRTVGDDRETAGTRLWLQRRCSRPAVAVGL
jgi:enediyne polyketide synthase